MTLDVERESRLLRPQLAGSPVWPKVFRLPGVYRPQDDTVMLAREYVRSGLGTDARVLELCCGTGYLSLVAAWAGAREVTAIDMSHRAVWSARMNARLFRAPITVRHGDFRRLPLASGFDVVLANPPYVPWFGDGGPCAKWDAGADGRAVIDAVCATAKRLVAPGGSLMIVHSAISNAEKTIRLLRRSGFTASVVARQEIPFGPVMRGREEQLRAAGFLRPGQDTEELVVIRADK